ncbi:STAS domain-containing protein [Algicola sagamiensis]|uniref:STAS domain-containing protein n=1 Tax=Algicola sagamiensis TaxID=163869 RepID=UPI00037EF785|nr:STAS domain-containing protein [Algicola sagamiensis]
MGLLEINLNKDGNCMVVSLNGRLDATSSEKLSNELTESIDQGERKIILACDDLEYISSAGLRVLLMAVKDLNARAGNLVIANASSTVRSVIEMTGFQRFLKLYDSIDIAKGELNLS